jgi:hypothetical protein
LPWEHILVTARVCCCRAVFKASIRAPLAVPGQAAIVRQGQSHSRQLKVRLLPLLRLLLLLCHLLWMAELPHLYAGSVVYRRANHIVL